MTQNNIDIMDIIVDKMADGMKLSKALEAVYVKRNVCFPCKEEHCNELIMEFGLSRRATNALLRAKLRTIGDVIEFCKENKITDIAGLGIGSGIEVFEAILDYCWNCMSDDEKVSFLIDTVERNECNIRKDVA